MTDDARGAANARALPAPGHGSPEMLREIVAELLGLVALHAEIGVGHAAAGDHAGVAYSVRKVVAYMRIAVRTTADLVEQFPPSDGRIEREWTTEGARR